MSQARDSGRRRTRRRGCQAENRTVEEEGGLRELPSYFTCLTSRMQLEKENSLENAAAVNGEMGPYIKNVRKMFGILYPLPPLVCILV